MTPLSHSPYMRRKHCKKVIEEPIIITYSQEAPITKKELKEENNKLLSCLIKERSKKESLSVTITLLFLFIFLFLSIIIITHGTMWVFVN